MSRKPFSKSRLAQGLATIAAVLLGLGGFFGLEHIMTEDHADAQEIEAGLNERNQLVSGHRAPKAAALRPIEDDVPVVSITFDDGNTSNARAGHILQKHGLTGTFYIISAFLETPNYLSRAELDQLVSDGNEIGGHTLHHRPLPTVDAAEARRQVCNDRDNLLAWGYEVTSFAYPEAESNQAIEKIVEDCGYNSARGLGGVRTKDGCENCVDSESFEPENPYRTKAPAMVTNQWSVDYLKKVVRKGVEDGGWTQLTFHDFCTDKEECNLISWTYDDFEDVVRWLAEEEKAGKLQVRNVNEVMTGKIQDSRPSTPPAQLAEGAELVHNGDFESTTQREREPFRCWEVVNFGNNTVTSNAGKVGVNGSNGMEFTVADYRSGDAKLLTKQDAGECAPEVAPGKRYRLAADYTADDITQFSVFLRGNHGQWVYWTSSTKFAPTDEFSRAEWITPEIPDGYDAISFGLAITGEGKLRVDNYSMQIPPEE
ncbi:polysaccharide deacetylase family protein [Micrococcoides hystricis]|uniref:Polysaccharide deacetylase family protein n=1 Tax=Micrococcoides hystricis TaxID=1572761 RepID=A0ABV6PAY5_9MICC